MSTARITSTASTAGPSDQVELGAEQRSAMLAALAAAQRRAHRGATFCFCGSDAELGAAYERLIQAQSRRAEEPAPEISREISDEEVEP